MNQRTNQWTMISPGVYPHVLLGAMVVVDATVWRWYANGWGSSVSLAAAQLAAEYALK